MTIQEEMSRINSPEKAELYTKSSLTLTQLLTLFLHRSSQEARTPLGTHPSGEQAGLVGTGASCGESVVCIPTATLVPSARLLAPPTRWKVNFLECVKREPWGAPGLVPAPEACSSSPRSGCWGLLASPRSGADAQPGSFCVAAAAEPVCPPGNIVCGGLLGTPGHASTRELPEKGHPQVGTTLQPPNKRTRGPTVWAPPA